jgi:WD repeat-containing protein 35
LLQLCNGIGTPIDFKYVDIEPKYVTMNAHEVLIASTDSFFLWRYVVPRKTLVDFGKANATTQQPSAPKLERSDT